VSKVARIMTLTSEISPFCHASIITTISVTSLHRPMTVSTARDIEIGISKASIFSGLADCATLGLPLSAGSDIMHLGTLNILDLMISLWRGTLDCTKPDDKST